MTQATLFSFKPPKINPTDPSLSNKTTNNPVTEPIPSEIKFKSQPYKNNSETEGKTSTKKDRGEGYQGPQSARTSPSPPPSITKKKRKATPHMAFSTEPDPRKEPRPHPIMSDPEFQKRYRKFLKRNGLEYGTSDPKKVAIWHRFWDVELKKWNDREEQKK
jgi:hypothetical protein